MPNNETTYAVRYTVVVDRPELRGPSYQVVRAGHRASSSIVCATQRGAVNLAAAMVAGEWDFGGEYVAVVEVVATRPGRPLRVVRRRVERTRSETTREWHFACLNVAAARRGTQLEAAGIVQVIPQHVRVDAIWS